MIIYAHCYSCKVHTILKDERKALGEWPCVPCPECGSSDVELYKEPKVVILIDDFRFRYGVDKEKVRASEVKKYRPRFDEDGLPWCNRDCPMYMIAAEQCEVLRRRPQSVCLPWMKGTLKKVGEKDGQAERNK